MSNETEQADGELSSHENGNAWPPAPTIFAPSRIRQKSSRLLTGFPLLDCGLGLVAGAVSYYMVFVLVLMSILDSMEDGGSVLSDRTIKDVHGFFLLVYFLFLRRYPWFAGSAFVSGVIGWIWHYGRSL